VEIAAQFAHWDAIDIHYRGTRVRSAGHGFSGIARQKLLNILSDRAQALGVTIHFKTEVLPDLSQFKDSDLIVACDGLRSQIREKFRDVFQPELDMRSAKYMWLGTKRIFESFTFLYEECEAGMFQVHAYRFDKDTSTFIVETDPGTWERAGLGSMTEDAQIAFLEKLFAKHLNGEKLLVNKSSWLHFGTLRCKRWSHENIVLMGDAAHTAHFSIGSGTKLAMEDAIALAKAFEGSKSQGKARVKEALDAYELERRIVVEKTQAAAQDSLLFFEHTSRYAGFDPLKFSFRLLTRSKKIGYDNLKLRDASYVDQVSRAFATEAGARELAGGKAPPPMFTPFALRDMRLGNRIVLSPMCMYSARDGVPDEFHLVHLGSRALGGAGLLFTEMTNVTAQGRITPGCTGIYNETQAQAWKRIVDFVHTRSSAKICLQLGHAGRKGSTKEPWLGQDVPLDTGNWELISASALAYSPKNQVPRAMTEADMAEVEQAYVQSAKFAEQAGFDMLEVHMAHGYLLASFLSPLTNVRTDAYGGSLEARMRFPMRVFDAVRAVWPKGRPMSVRLSATDWYPGGLTGEDSVHIARALKEHGCDLIDVSTGQTVPDGRPAFYGRMFQTPFADQIRNDVGMPTMAVGNITTADQANTILAAGRADLIALAREHLRDPHFTYRAAVEAGVSHLPWPHPYGLVAPRPL
jgi:anthraniloyl-CoA monooxygenase